MLRVTGDVLAAFEHVYVEAAFEALYKSQALVDEVIAQLFAAGFAEAGRYNVSLGPDGQPIQADFLFRRTA